METKAPKKNVAAKTKALQQKAPKERPVIYVGPGFKDWRLNHCMIFRSGIPAPEGDDPVLRRLFVMPDALNQALADIKKPGTALHTFYMQAVAKHTQEMKTRGGN